MIVEDGTAKADADSYVSEDDFDTYCDDRGITPATGDAEAALIRATQWIDATYGARFPGYRLKGREQALQWPRADAYDRSGYPSGRDQYGNLIALNSLIPSDEVPVEIVNATCEAALRELTELGSLAPDLDRGGQIKELHAGSVGLTYGSNAPATTTFQIIDRILANLIGMPSSISGTAVRG